MTQQNECSSSSQTKGKEFHSEEFNPNQSGQDLTSLLQGKVLSKVEVDNEHMDPILYFEFTDGTVLGLEYDWIYEWNVATKEIANE